MINIDISQQFKSKEIQSKNGFFAPAGAQLFSLHEKKLLEKQLLNKLNYFFSNAPHILEAANASQTVLFAGGFLESVLTGRNVEDIDIFCSKATSKFIVDQLIFHGVSIRKTLDTQYLEEYKYQRTYYEPVIKLQFISSLEASSLDELLKTFDFTCNKCGFSVVEGNICLKYGETFFEDVYNRVLNVDEEIINEERAAKTLARTVKYVSRGYSVHLDTLQKISDAIAKYGAHKIRPPGTESYIKKEH